MAKGFLDPAKNAVCASCGKPFRKHRKARNSHYCSSQCYGDHMRCSEKRDYCPTKYRGKYIERHRLVMQQHIGGPIPDGFFVHHKNGDPQDNRLENLELMPRGEHTRMHMLEVHARRKAKLTHDEVSEGREQANSRPLGQSDCASTDPSADPG
jgi:hypothetical protein